jgi:hypothetical protein
MRRTHDSCSALPLGNLTGVVINITVSFVNLRMQVSNFNKPQICSYNLLANDPRIGCQLVSVIHTNGTNSSIRSSTSKGQHDVTRNSEQLTAYNAQRPARPTRCITDQQKMSAASLKVIQSLICQQTRFCFRIKPYLEALRTVNMAHDGLMNLQLMSGLASGRANKAKSETFLQSSGLYVMSCVCQLRRYATFHFTHPLDQEHANEVILLTSLVNRDT